ncbi:iron ABC transporter substrate-binding protein [Marinomonas sp. 42_23_T18]|nr:iron ABC transporter substrate-binding protein [Marinomonas sp. 42_23_T18]
MILALKLVISLLTITSGILFANPVVFKHESLRDQGANFIQEPRLLNVYSAVDLDAFEPLLRAYIEKSPNTIIAYYDVNTLELYHKVVAEKDRPKASLIISSAMDLQLKLVNDGLAKTYQSSMTQNLPDMAKWRNQIFAFSLEPVVMLVNQNRFPGEILPKNRLDLLKIMRQHSDAFQGKIGTYDIRTSGVGYLLASQDARQADATWGRLIEAFGSHQVQTYCCTSAMIDDVANGDLLLGYNLLGSYANKRALGDPRLTMIMPSDYTLLLMRSALIPKFAPNSEDAGLFIDFLLSPTGQKLMLSENLLFPIDSASQAINISPKRSHPTRIIELDQQLLVGRDHAKQSRFIRSWESALELTELE